MVAHTRGKGKRKKPVPVRANKAKKKKGANKPKPKQTAVEEALQRQRRNVEIDKLLGEEKEQKEFKEDFPSVNSNAFAKLNKATLLHYVETLKIPSCFDSPISDKHTKAEILYAIKIADSLGRPGGAALVGPPPAGAPIPNRTVTFANPLTSFGAPSTSVDLDEGDVEQFALASPTRIDLTQQTALAAPVLCTHCKQKPRLPPLPLCGECAVKAVAAQQEKLQDVQQRECQNGLCHNQAGPAGVCKGCEQATTDLIARLSARAQAPGSPCQNTICKNTTTQGGFCNFCAAARQTPAMTTQHPFPAALGNAQPKPAGNSRLHALDSQITPIMREVITSGKIFDINHCLLRNMKTIAKNTQGPEMALAQVVSSMGHQMSHNKNSVVLREKFKMPTGLAVIASVQDLREALQTVVDARADKFGDRIIQPDREHLRTFASWFTRDNFDIEAFVAAFNRHIKKRTWSFSGIVDPTYPLLDDSSFDLATMANIFSNNQRFGGNQMRMTHVVSTSLTTRQQTPRNVQQRNMDVPRGQNRGLQAHLAQVAAWKRDNPSWASKAIKDCGSAPPIYNPNATKANICAAWNRNRGCPLPSGHDLPRIRGGVTRAQRLHHKCMWCGVADHAAFNCPSTYPDPKPVQL
jgi:hypothetical protein